MTTTTNIANVKLDRPHRFAIGDTVRHVDDSPGSAGCLVQALTLDIVDGVAYPTYTLEPQDDSHGGESFDCGVDGELLIGVLCTRDLVAVR